MNLCQKLRQKISSKNRCWHEIFHTKSKIHFNSKVLLSSTTRAICLISRRQASRARGQWIKNIAIRSHLLGLSAEILSSRVRWKVTLWIEDHNAKRASKTSKSLLTTLPNFNSNKVCSKSSAWKSQFPIPLKIKSLFPSCSRIQCQDAITVTIWSTSELTTLIREKRTLQTTKIWTERRVSTEPHL